MIEIVKNQETEGLKALRESEDVKGLSPGAAFKMLRNPLKSEVIESLLCEQGHLCVYCMCRIPGHEPDIAPVTIEHFIPLNPPDGRDIGQALDYQNLFAVCHGNTKRHIRGERRSTGLETQTCDKHRLNTEFRKINPLKGETLQSICYKSTGEIDATDTDVRYDLTEILNLNCPSSPLVEERKSVLTALQEEMVQFEGERLEKYCTSRLKAFMNERDPKTPYVGVLIWYLKTTKEELSRCTL